MGWGMGDGRYVVHMRLVTDILFWGGCLGRRIYGA